MADERLIDGSRDYDCCRYFDLIRRIDEFYADGIITPAELNRMQDMRSETLINYQVALGMLKHMNPGAKDYDKLTELVDYLRRCWQVMSQAYYRGTLVHRGENPEPQKPNKKIVLNVGAEQAALLASVSTTSLRQEADMKNIDAELAKLSPDEKERASGRVVRALEELERDKMTAARHHLMDLERIK